MAFDLTKLQPARAQSKPPRMLLYGPPGVGKTTFGAMGPKPVILPTEDGLSALDVLDFDVPAFPVAKTWADVMGALEALATQEHGFQTLQVDSIDWLEPIVYAETCRRNQWADIEAPGYGKGYQAAMDVWRQFLDALDYLRDEKGMAIILIGHSLVKRFDAPDTEPYDRYMLKLQQRAADLLTEAMDMVLFANFKTYTTSTDVGFKKSVRRGTGSGQRILYTEERPAFVAKNRHALPAELPFTWDALIEAIAGNTKSPAGQPASVPEGEDTAPDNTEEKE